MDFKSNSAPQNARREQPQRADSGEYQHVSRPSTSGGRGSMPFKSLTLVIVAVVLVVVVALGGMMWMKQRGAGGMSSVKKDQYQAVFLSNGQVYFGKIADMNKSQVKLEKIYYLQVQQSVQPAEQKKDDKQQQISLAKLGEELHGPEDTMYIAKDQMLFWENLKDSGKVVQAIKSAGQK